MFLINSITPFPREYCVTHFTPWILHRCRWHINFWLYFQSIKVCNLITQYRELWQLKEWAHKNKLEHCKIEILSYSYSRRFSLSLVLSAWLIDVVVYFHFAYATPVKLVKKCTKAKRLRISLHVSIFFNIFSCDER